MKKEQAVITITEDKGKLNVNLVFTPSAKVKGPMRITHSAAMAAVNAITVWSKGGGS